MNPRPTSGRVAPAALLLAIALAASGCGTLAPNPAKSYFVLQDLSQAPAVPTPRQVTAAPRPERAPVVLVSVNPSSTLYESAGIVFSRGPGERAYYQFATWSERPSRRLGLLVERRLVGAIASGVPLGGAALDTSGVRGDWLLGVRLVELYHDTLQRPHRAVVTLEVELVDWERRTLLDRATFHATAPLVAEEVEAAVTAMNQGVTAVLDDLNRWVAQKAFEVRGAAAAKEETTSTRARGRPPKGANRPPRPCPPHCP